MPKFLHVGCGSKRKAQTTKGFNTPEWEEIRLDIDRAVQPDIIGSMTDMKAIAAQSVDAVYSSHNIEHLYAYEVPIALGEFLRVLKPNGLAVITCPDLQSVCTLVADNKLTQAAYQSSMGPITPLDILYGHQASIQKGNVYMAHRCGFTRDVLSGSLRYAGFTSVIAFSRPKNFDLWAFASKESLSQEQLINIVKLHGLA
jgi:ubiquinone/menaquinone biosynthesis C-methylase UbiE